MGKRIATTDYFMIDGVSFSNGEVRSINFNSDDEQVPVGGFNASGTTEVLPGQRTRSVTLEMYTDRASGAMNQVLYPLHRDKASFDFVWRANQNAAVSATNQELRGTVKLPSWNEGASFGEAEVTTLEFISQISNPLEKYET